jgi:cytoplasmic iron level regulating protein YaaA (DUF328/UPF0246 family)
LLALRSPKGEEGNLEPLSINMIILMNSSKTLDFQQKARISKHTIPEHLKDAAILVKKLRKLSEPEFSRLLKVSEKLAKLNIERYANWKTNIKGPHAKQALLAFKGDIYSGMNIETYKTKDFEFAQQHMRILSGLYGILRPLDLIQPYRLEMAIKLATNKGKNLYQFWGTKINASTRALMKREKSGVLVNLCSVEYFKAIKSDLLDAKVIKPVFKEFKDGSYRFVTIYAKKARGLMCNYVIRNHLDCIEDIKFFNVAGYQYNKTISSDNEWVFTRGESESN